jgi:hypothetical protein
MGEQAWRMQEMSKRERVRERHEAKCLSRALRLWKLSHEGHITSSLSSTLLTMRGGIVMASIEVGWRHWGHECERWSPLVMHTRQNMLRHEGSTTGSSSGFSQRQHKMSWYGLLHST